MNPIAFLGALGTLIGLVRALPQLIQLLKARKAHGVSVDTAGTSSVVSFGWAYYGWLTDQAYVTLATGSSGIIFALIVFFAIRFGRSWREIRVTALWILVLVLSKMLWGVNGLGIALPLSVLIANAPQIMVACKEGDLSDLSLGTWLLSISDGLVWGFYALIGRDYSILAYGIFQLLTSGAIATFKIAHQRKEKIATLNKKASGGGSFV